MLETRVIKFTRNHLYVANGEHYRMNFRRGKLFTDLVCVGKVERTPIFYFFSIKSTATKEVVSDAAGSENQIAFVPKISGKVIIKNIGIIRD